MKKKRVGSIKSELISKSREAMLSAVQIFNNPNILFKAESFVVLAIISWTYLLHAYYRDKGIEYRYYKKQKTRRKFDKTKFGAFKYWELERCLNDTNCPIESTPKKNLFFLIGLRHEIEHQMTMRIDDLLSARFQACCLNYNKYIKKFFGEKYGIDKHLSFSLQFTSIGEDHISQLSDYPELPKNIEAYITRYDSELAENEFNNPEYSYRVFFIPKIVNHRGQADKVIEFISADSAAAQGANKEIVAIKEKEKTKYLPSQIVEIMQEKGYKRFRIYEHTQLWKAKKAKDKNKNYGVDVSGAWYWYDSWLKEVEQHCQQNKERYF